MSFFYKTSRNIYIYVFHSSISILCVRLCESMSVNYMVQCSKYIHFTTEDAINTIKLTPPCPSNTPNNVFNCHMVLNVINSTGICIPNHSFYQQIFIAVSIEGTWTNRVLYYWVVIVKHCFSFVKTRLTDLTSQPWVFPGNYGPEAGDTLGNGLVLVAGLTLGDIHWQTVYGQVWVTNCPACL